MFEKQRFASGELKIKNALQKLSWSSRRKKINLRKKI
jgi:hypothetical protein